MDYATFLYSINYIVSDPNTPRNKIIGRIKSFIHDVYASGDTIFLNDDVKIVSACATVNSSTVCIDFIRAWVEPPKYPAPLEAVPLLKSGKFEFYLSVSKLGSFILRLDDENAVYVDCVACINHSDPLFRQAVNLCNIGVSK